MSEEGVPVAGPPPLDGSKPWRTEGRRIWWIPDEWALRGGIRFRQEQVLYRDHLRSGIWVPEERLSADEKKTLEEMYG